MTKAKGYILLKRENTKTKGFINSIYFNSRLIAHGENVQYRMIKNN